MNNKNNKNSVFKSIMLLVPEIKQLIKEKKFFELKDILKYIHPIDLAEGFNNFDKDEQLIIFRLLKFNKAIAVFEDLDPEEQAWIIENLEQNPLEKLVEDMPADERGKLVRRLPERVKKKLLSCVRKEDLHIIQQTLNYKEGTAGAIMNTYFISLSPQMTAKQAIEHIHMLSKFRKYSSLHAFYVVDNNRKLLGGVTLRKLVAAPSDIKVSEIMSSVNFIKINVDMSKEDVARLFAKYDLVIAPVVDENDILVGVITVDDVIDIINQLSTAQLYEVGKITGKEEIKYQDATPFYLFKRRVGWLALLLVFDFLTGTVLKTFEHAISSVVALTFFIPMLLDTGGNAGAQTVAILTRSFATGDVSFKNIFKVIKVEIISALISGVVLGVIAFLRGLSLGVNLNIAIVVGLTMCVIIILAISSGVFLPIISKRFGLDPAVLSGPLITSIVDVCGLIIYFKIAQLLIPQLRNM
jgi:magnesium transporter